MFAGGIVEIPTMYLSTLSSLRQLGFASAMMSTNLTVCWLKNHCLGRNIINSICVPWPGWLASLI